MKPRDSMQTTVSILLSRHQSQTASTASRKSRPSRISVVMSLKTIPFFGKSGTLRIASLSLLPSVAIVSPSLRRLD